MVSLVPNDRDTELMTGIGFILPVFAEEADVRFELFEQFQNFEYRNAC